MTTPLAPLDDLDEAFTCPAWLPDNFKTLYESLVVRMRRESAGIPMNTVQVLLIERIAFNYVIMRFRENAPAGDPNAFVSAATQKDFNTFWLAMTQEFNKVLRAFSKSDRDLAVAQMRQIVTTAINAEVASVTTRKAIMSKTYDGLVEVGLVDA